MSGTVCDLENNFCAYGTAHCFCQSNAGMLQWQCFAATADPGCPGQIPQVGTRCPTYGLQCDYNRPGAQGGFVVCAQDANRVSRWQDRSTMQATCPTM